MKEKLLIASLIVASSTSFALEGNLKVGGDLDVKFKSYEDDETTSDLNEKRFDYSETGYNLELVNLNLSEKDYGIKFGTVLKSSRKNILVDDWSNEQYNKLESRKSKNHDVQGKLFVNWENPNKESKLSGKAGFEYYLDNYFRKMARDKNNIVAEKTYDYEYIEDKDHKYLGGDIKLNAGVSFKPINNLTLSNDIEYYANRVVDYSKGYPYFKTVSKLSYDITDKSKLEFNHDFNFNLRSLAQAYVEGKENEDNEEYLFLDNFVRRYKQKADAKYTLNTEKSSDLKDNYEISANFKDDGFYIGGPRYLDPREIENHRLELNLKGSANNQFLVKGYKLNLKNELALENKAESAHYVRNNKNVLWAAIVPTYTLGLGTELNLGDFKISPEFKANTKLVFPLYKNIFRMDYFVNRYTFDLNTKVEYNKNNLEAKFEVNNNTELSLLTDVVSKITGKFEQKLDSKYKYDEKLNLTLVGGNTVEISTVNDVQSRIYLDTLKGKYNLKGGLDYTLLQEKDNKLTLSSHLGLNNEYEFGYLLDGGRVPYIPPKAKPEQPEQPNIIEKPEINYPAENPKPTTPSRNSLENSSTTDLNGHNVFKDYDIKMLDPTKRNFTNEAKLLLTVQRYAFDAELKHTNKINKIDLENSIKLDTELDLIGLVKEKKTKLRNSEEDDIEKRIDLITSEPGDIKYNIGGKVIITPNTSLQYNFNDNLSVKGKVELPIEFSKLVLNKITDKNRTDKDTYGPQDREFKLRKITPKLGFELNYKW